MERPANLLQGSAASLLSNRFKETVLTNAPTLYYLAVMIEVTDTIPRIQVAQLLSVADKLAAGDGKGTFDSVRTHLLRELSRKAPATDEAMWTIARDVLSELSRLNYANVGPLPRKRSEVLRLASTPCELTPTGHALGENYRSRRAQAFDELLNAWMEHHPYFLMFMHRVLAGPLFVPDITSIKQVSTERGEIDLNRLSDLVLKSCEDRLTKSDFDPQKLLTFRNAVKERFFVLFKKNHIEQLDAKGLVDAVQDTIVLPALLQAEQLPFDAVTFQHVLRASQDFLTASWTTSHPDFAGRVVFRTCSMEREDDLKSRRQIVHHGVSYVEQAFSDALIAAYGRLIKETSSYVNAYALRAIVCLNLEIQPQVFERCLATRIAAKEVGGMKIFTELPFSPPPAGEDYVKAGFDRIGLIKLS